jgi:hypothetical protein
MPGFIKRIDNLEFSFKRIQTPNGLRYYVSVTDANGDAFYFNMKEDSDRWKIINAPKVPDWIIELEKKLANLILIKEAGG